jgi:replicative DNA helicase
MQNQLFSMDLAKAEKSLQDLRIGLSEVQMADSETVDASLEERIALYERTKANEGVIGVQTGFEFFDKVVGGIRTEYIGIIGTSGVGKTYFFLRVAMNYAAQVDGCILIVTNEMSVEDISTRCDSIVGEFSATKYREGRLNAEEESRLRQLSSLYTQMGKVHVISGAGKSIDDIELEMIRLEPAAVFIDGVYLSVETGKDLFKDTMIASRKIQALTKKYKTPFIGTFQFNADGDIAYAKSVRQDVDILLKIYQSQAMLMNVPPLMGFEFLKTRMARNGAKGLNVWDFENWNFEEIPENEGGQYTEDSFNG